MDARVRQPHLVIGMTPCGEPDAGLCGAISAAGGLGVLDLGAGDRRAREELARAATWTHGRPVGIRVPAGCALTLDDVTAALGDRAGLVEVVVLDGSSPRQIADIPDTYVTFVEVTSVSEAVAAEEAGAGGVIARGNEAGGRVGESGAFVLLQQLMAEQRLTLPVWLCGGIGLRTAAAAVVGGAAGVVIDTQLALLPESALPDEIRTMVSASDGSDTTIIDGHRVLARKTPPRIATASEPATGVVNDLTGARPLALGQDAYLASRFAQHYGSVAKSVRAILSAVHDAVRSADDDAILAPGSPLAHRLGTALPVAQGPMTRVSDQPGFAAAVAAQGGLPFVALALATAEQTRSMLEQTRAALGDRPWGVGLLGFAPEELRSAQLDVVREVRPPTALIAGGRPDQATALEELGIATFLHVPSPGLLTQFLQAGARKFIFEGAECGGHVGPRSSFSLWEAQLGVLLDFIEAGGDASTLQVLFAGGVHDARSAAMVAALARPLARRGAAVGVLMGTGYLFTEEAVTHGAVQPVFQQQVLAARTTELLETAPGHATRCVTSPYTAGFRSIGARLAEQAVPERQIWEQLEQLNVGRLRIASKGVRREGSELVAVDEAEQLEQGLFMAGQVATLRSTVTTIRELHHDVTTGAAAYQAARAGQLRAELGIAEPIDLTPPPVDVAIVGMACVFPGARDLAEFWSNVVGNTDSVTEVPPQRWDADIYYTGSDGRGAGDRTPSKWGGFLDRIPFDALRYGIPPAALAAIEPVQLLALEVAHRALVDAGYRPGGFDSSRTSVVFGGETNSDLATAQKLRMVLPSYLGELPAEFDEQLPRLTEDSFPGMLANVVAGRIANRLDLGGANYTVAAACASSLAAVDLACKELSGGTSDMVLCGGADLHNDIGDYLMFSSIGALSPSGRCRTFDASADGIALGEGVACVVLKRLTDAERDGDRIYAVIKGVGSSSDGKALGLTAPRTEGQRRALDRAYRNAGISPAEVGVVEAHGTGTVVGDRTELRTLEQFFTEAGAAPGSCVLGSVKSQIGHTKCAAGLAGLIKTAMALHTGVRPPTLHLAEPNPAWDPRTSPFVFHDTAAPWLQAPGDRVAGVSAFGFGGTNFHVVLRAHSSAEFTRQALTRWPAELFTFRGADDAAAVRQVERLLSLVAANDAAGRPWSLLDLAGTAANRANRDPSPVRIAVVAGNLDELTELLRRAAAGQCDPARGLFRAGARTTGGKLAVLFPGQGSQRRGMLADLFVAFPELARIATRGGAQIEAMFPPAAFGADGVRAQDDRLRDTTRAQPALGVCGLAVHHLLTRLGVVPDMYAGHSYGELVALAAAGSVDHPTLLALSVARAQAILGATGDDPGGMAAIAAEGHRVEKVLTDAGLGDQVVVANHNAPRQVVISGPTEALDAALDAVRAAKLSAKRIPVACAFHSPVVRDAAESFAKTLAAHPIHRPDRPVWSNRTAAPYPANPADIRAELARQIVSPVRFVDQVEAMYAEGARVFLEAGPGRVLSGLVDKILGDRPHTVVSIEGPSDAGLRGFLLAGARLAVTGADLRTGWLFTGRGARDVATLTPPPKPGWTVDGQLVRTADGKILPGGFTPARRVRSLTVAQPASPAPLGREELVSEFLRSSRELVAAQRDVLLSYFGAPAAPAAPALPAAPVEPVRIDQAPRVTEGVPAAPARPAALPAQAGPPPGRPTHDVDVLATVVEVIAERTGYPAEMIDAGMDLEADLSVDSIKRTEIAGELAARLGLATARDRIEEMVKARTAATMAQALSGASATAPAPPVAAQEQVPGKPQAIAGAPPRRFVLDLVEAAGSASAEPAVLVDARILVAGGDPGIADEVAGRLSAHGALPTVVNGTPDLGEWAEDIDGLICLHAMGDDEPVLPAAFPMVKTVLSKGPRWVLAVAPRAGDAVPASAAGLRGFFRTLHREYPDTVTRLIELDSAAGAETTATVVVDELRTMADEPVVVVADGHRRAFRMVPAALPGVSPGAAVPAGLGEDSVVLLIGGGRGITAQVAAALAAASGCRIELAGRTSLPSEPEPAAVEAAADLPALRAALARLGRTDPAAIDRTAREILAQREVTATLRELRGHGSRAEYHTVDVRDTEAIRQLIKGIHTRYGRIDGVVHAAGVIEDRLLADKDPVSFNRVYSTKVDGATSLLDQLDELRVRPRFVVFFGSIAATLGNRGQADYAAANDALDTLGAAWAARTGNRTLTVHWGPWAPADGHGGMVSAELSRTYADRGVSLIDPAQGVDVLLRELAWGPPSLRSVIYTASGW